MRRAGPVRAVRVAARGPWRRPARAEARSGRARTRLVTLPYPTKPYPILPPRAPAGFPADSLFHGTDIAERVHVRWGTFALVDATRALLRAALADRANARFALLSESGIPLYPPAALHQQLTAERRSRINACAVPGVRRALASPSLCSHAPRPAAPPALVLTRTGVLDIKPRFKSSWVVRGMSLCPPAAQQLLVGQSDRVVPGNAPACTQPALTACPQLLLKHGGLCSNRNVLECDCTHRIARRGRTSIACTAHATSFLTLRWRGGTYPNPTPAGRGRTSATCTAGWARWSPTSSSGSTGARAANGAAGSGHCQKRISHGWASTRTVSVHERIDTRSV
jgi:hypothetical protein